MAWSLHRHQRTAVAIALYAVALVVSIALSGAGLVAPFAFVVTCFVAWELGLWPALAWVVVSHLLVPASLWLSGVGPFHHLPDYRPMVAVLLAGSTIADVILAGFVARLRTATADLLQSRAAVAESNERLQAALDEVRELRGYLPICAWCKDIRDISGSWERIESYVTRHSRATFTHCLCPKCRDRLGTGEMPAAM